MCIAAANAGDTSQDLKTGFLIGATPRKQQIALVIGVCIYVGDWGDVAVDEPRGWRSFGRPRGRGISPLFTTVCRWKNRASTRRRSGS